MRGTLPDSGSTSASSIAIACRASCGSGCRRLTAILGLARGAISRAFGFGIHRFMGTGLAIVNTIGNGVATLVVAAWERELDRDRLNAEMSRRRGAA